MNALCLVPHCELEKWHLFFLPLKQPVNLVWAIDIELPYVNCGYEQVLENNRVGMVPSHLG